MTLHQYGMTTVFCAELHVAQDSKGIFPQGFFDADSVSKNYFNPRPIHLTCHLTQNPCGSASDSRDADQLY